MKLKNIFISALLLILAGCSVQGDDKMVKEAEKYAVEDAREVGQSLNDSIQTRNLLLRSRSIETRLRQKGCSKAADVYVSVFEETLRTEYPELAKEILGPPR